MTNELGIVIENNRPVVSSRKVAEIFEKEHKHVMRDIKELCIDEVFGRSNFGLTSYKDCYNREQPEYLMTRDGFTLLAMGFTGSKAMQWKIKYIEAFNKMEAELAIPLTIPKILPDFNNPAIAARAWADQYERVSQLEAVNKANEPLTNLGKAITKSPDYITIAEFVPIMKQAGITHGYDGKRLWQNNLYAMLRADGFLLSRPKNKPSIDARERKLFFVEESIAYDAFGRERINSITLVTGEGQVYITHWYKKHRKEFNN